MIRSACAAALSLNLALLLPWHCAWAKPDAIDFHIPGKPLSQALIDLALQGHLSIGHVGIDLAGIAGQPVEGQKSPAEALDMLLQGSGLGYFFADPKTVVLVRRSAARTAPPVMPAIEDIVVTADKRPAIARTLPEAVVVVPGDSLAEEGGATEDLTRHAAGLTAVGGGPGQDKIFIRGLSDSVLSGRTQSMVGLYIDEARLTEDAPDPDLRMSDIDHVEIARGPQGTLYGAGALAGVVRIVTNKPELDRYGGSVAVDGAVTAEGAPSGSIDAVLNLPLAEDDLALRTVLYSTHEGGYLDDVRLGDKNANGADTQGGRAALLWKPDQDWSATLNAIAQNLSSADANYYPAGQGFGQRLNLMREPRTDKFRQVSLEIQGDLGWATLISSTAYTTRRIQTSYDASAAWPALTGFSGGPALFADDRGIRSISHETRLEAPPQDGWAWVAGLALSHRDEDYESSLIGPDAGKAYSAFAETRDDEADDAALFGQASYDVTDWLAATAGMRVFGGSNGASARLRQGSAAAVDLSGKDNAIEMTHKAALTLKPADEAMLYVSAADGFRLGGINIGAPAGAQNADADGGERSESPRAFSSDTLWTYEAGVKSSLWGGRLIADAAVFLSLWSNIQSDQILPNGSWYIANAGNVRAPGAELDATLQATSELSLEAHLYHGDPHLSHSNPLLVQINGVLPGVPKSSAALSARYELALSEADRAFLTLSTRYAGRSYAGFDPANSTAMGNYWTGAVSLGWRHEAWQAVLRADNVTDSHANSFAYGNPFLAGRQNEITPLRPRTVGLTLTRSF